MHLRAVIGETAQKLAQWLEVAGDYMSFGEAEIWMHLHDARHKDHDQDFHCLFFLAGEFLRAGGRSTFGSTASSSPTCQSSLMERAGSMSLLAL